jgi:hypothetical protein
VGRRAQAIAQIEDAACIYRRLAEAAPDAYLSDQERSLYGLALVQVMQAGSSRGIRARRDQNPRAG